MATHPSWSGYLKISLVVCPIKLFNATTHAHTVSFHFIHPETRHRVQMKPFDADFGQVERKDLVRGYEVAKGKYLTVSDEDLEHVQLASTKTIEIDTFVEEGSIDLLYQDTPYFVVPDGAAAAEPYGVIRDAMRQEKKCAIGRLVLSHREHAVAISPRHHGMIAVRLRDRREVEDEKRFFDRIAAIRANSELIDIATRIIDQKSGRFDPRKYEDRYETALKEMLKRRARGAKEVAEKLEEPKPTNVVDLMSVLRASLKGSKAPAKASQGRTRKKSGGNVVPLRKRPASGGARRKTGTR